MALKEKVGQALEWLRTVVRSWPALAAGLTVVITTVAEQVVPLLPEHWAVRALGVLAAVGAGIAAVSLAVARLTPVLFPENRGVLAPPPAQQPTGLSAYRNVRTGSNVTVYPEGDLPPAGPEVYPADADRWPHRRT